MFDYLNSYGDMSVFLVWLDDGNISQAIDILSKEMGFVFKEKRERCTVYKCTTDERSFLLSVEGTTPEHFYLLYIKCKSALKNLFFNCIDKHLQEMEDWGMRKKSAEEYKDLLSFKLDPRNPYVKNLIEFGLLENIWEKQNGNYE